jgi:DNA mismatch repair protein MutS
VENFNVAVAEENGQVTFLHKIVAGGADRSYGIHVAQLAGLPRPVINRAQEILRQLEREGTKAVDSRPHDRGRAGPPAQQLSLFSTEPHPALLALREIDVNNLTPLEAISLLYELQKKAADTGTGN